MKDRDFISDVAVVGAGIAGAAIGAHLARAGLSVVVLEAEDRPGYHATGRSAAFWLESYGGEGIAPLTAASRAFLDQPPANFSPHGFLHPRGAIHIARAGEEGAFNRLPASVATERLDPARLASLVPGLKAPWSEGLAEPGCREIDVAGLHQAYLASLSRSGGTVVLNAELQSAERTNGEWDVALADGRGGRATRIVNAAGAWADEVARRCGAAPLGLCPRRRTMVQLRIDRDDLADLPLILAADESFYFRGESADTIWLSPHDESDSDPCDAAPEEFDVATAVHRLEQVVDWRVLGVTRKWAGLRTFAPDRLPAIGYDRRAEGFFWYAGQGGTGIQTQPAAAALARALFLDQDSGAIVPDIVPALYRPDRFA